MDKEILNCLLEKKVELQQRIKAIDTDFSSVRAQDFSDQTKENENNAVLNEVSHEAKFELRLVNLAITCFENNQYGFCSQCAKPINSERLKVLPYIDTCIDCAEEQYG